MFLITIDKSGRLLVEQTVLNANGNPHYLARVPTISDDSSREDITNWLIKIGADSASVWKQEIDNSIAVAMNQIVKQVEIASPGAAKRFESQLLQDFDLNKVSPRVFFANSETVVANESLISFLGAFAVASGHKTARLCMHQDQTQVIQEMLMIHAEQISTGPLRQDRDSSVSYHMMRGALEITLHHGGATGDKVYQVECSRNQPSVNSSLRVPARVFRTIRTLTDSAVFIEAQSGPFSDSDTQWDQGAARR